MKSSWFNRLGLVVVGSLWLFMVITVLTQRADIAPIPQPPSPVKLHELHQESLETRPVRARATLVLPKRQVESPLVSSPPPLSEIAANMTLYLHELHRRLEALAGPRISPVAAWETFLEVTRAMPMTWDEENRYLHDI